MQGILGSGRGNERWQFTIFAGARPIGGCEGLRPHEQHDVLESHCIEPLDDIRAGNNRVWDDPLKKQQELCPGFWESSHNGITKGFPNLVSLLQ